MSNLAHLPRTERVRRYRELAAESYRDADRHEGAVRLSFLSLAEGWELLAKTVEDSIARGETNAAQAQQQAAPSRPLTHKR